LEPFLESILKWSNNSLILIYIPAQKSRSFAGFFAFPAPGALRPGKIRRVSSNLPPAAVHRPGPASITPLKRITPFFCEVSAAIAARIFKGIIGRVGAKLEPRYRDGMG
jgi:hypothetical protein